MSGTERRSVHQFLRVSNVLLVHWLALADGQNTRESVKPLSYQPVGASMMSVNVVLMSRPCTGHSKVPIQGPSSAAMG